MSFKLDISGLQAAIKSIDKIAVDVKKKGNDAFTEFGKNVERDAKNTLQRGNGRGFGPTSNTGQLAGSINATTSTNLKTEITVAKNYAAYIEFGTKKFAAQYVASLPQDWQTYAGTFRGKGGGGSFDELVLAIEQWLKDRQIGSKVKGQTKDTTRKADAYAIALHIVRFGIKPQPYLKPALDKFTPELTKDLQAIFK